MDAMNAPEHDTPDGQGLLTRDQDIPVPRGPGTQQDAIGHEAELLDGEFPIDHGDDDAAVGWVDGSIDDQQIAIMQADASHGMAFDPNEESGFPVLDQVLVETEAVLKVVGGGGREASGNGFSQQRVAGHIYNPRFWQ